MTITEKILARESGASVVSPGDNIWVNVGILLTHDVCGPGTIGIFHREFGKDAKVFDREKIVILPDHYIFTADEKAHRNVDTLRVFVKEQGLPYFYDPGTENYCGVCHVAMPELGHVRPGETIFGTDSHTCTHGALGAFSTGIGNTDAGFIMGTGKLLVKVPPTIRFVLDGELPPYLSAKDLILHIIGDIGVDGATYHAMEFTGSAIEALSIDERCTICNMAVEAGAKNGIIAPDRKTIDYVKARTKKPFEPLFSDPDAKVADERRYDVSRLEPVVAKPHLPDNKALARACSDVKIDQVYIGSCTGGKLEDFIMAAKVMQGKRVAVRTLLVPATRQVEKGLDETKIGGQSLRAIFEEAGVEPIAPPSCAACLGGPVDTFGRTHGHEVVVSTTNRNFIGRMGSKDARIYLASPYTAAASSLTGHITDPRTVRL
ncbi:MAG TPA: 3-isopropylmalate dehydratase large subunit [Kiritimatiellia bacterium]|nr:3-isopropylmalate dehydratase large subunit [Kiritimatiellia bacterium]HRU19091.1 3-isopropylmalate dehydratase large subunit [Kiritimatiellia bacterium]